MSKNTSFIIVSQLNSNSKNENHSHTQYISFDPSEIFQSNIEIVIADKILSRFKSNSENITYIGALWEIEYLERIYQVFRHLPDFIGCTFKRSICSEKPICFFSIIRPKPKRGFGKVASKRAGGAS